MPDDCMRASLEALRDRGDLLLVLERVQSLLVLERELRLLLRVHRAQVRVCARNHSVSSAGNEQEERRDETR